MYNPEKIDDLGLVMAPPYASLSEEEQTDLYNRHEYNSVRLSKGMHYADDSETNNPATRARDFLKTWIKDDIIKRDSQPAVYLYEQVAEYNKTTFTNKGFVALLGLEELGGSVLTCEDTEPVNKQHHYDLLSEAKANFSMINCLYVESEKDLSRMMTEISDTSPDVSFKIPDGTTEHIWRICDPEKIEFITKILSAHTLYIADGQNRYETSLRYQKHCIENNPNHTGDEPYNYILTLLTNAFDDGIVQLPFHRLVKFKKQFNESFVVAACQDNFKVEKIIVDTDTSEFSETLKKQIATTRHENKIALYCGGEYFYRLTLKSNAPLKNLFPDKSDAYISLDSTVLNSLILSKVLGIEESDYKDRIEYTKSVSDGIKMVKSGEYGCLFAINPATTWQVCSVATAGDKMPSKTICVFPKPASGIIMNLL